MSAPDAPDWIHPDASWAWRAWMYSWVVPRAQWDLHDVEYQIYTFDLFHQDWKTKWIHRATIPGILLATFAFLAQWPLWEGAPAALNAGSIYAAGVALLHLPAAARRGMIPLWVATAATIAALFAAGTAWHGLAAVPGAPWYAPTALIANPLLWMYALSLVETASHGLEPVPPYNNGTDRWMTPAEFRSSGGRWTVLAGFATPTIFTVVSFLSNPRSIAQVVLEAMFTLGYRRELQQKVAAAVASEWRLGQPRMHWVPGVSGAGPRP